MQSVLSTGTEDWRKKLKHEELAQAANGSQAGRRQKFTPPEHFVFRQQLGQDTAPSMHHDLISGENSRSRRGRGAVHIAVSRWSRGTPRFRYAMAGAEQQPRGGGGPPAEKKSDKGSINSGLAEFLLL